MEGLSGAAMGGPDNPSALVEGRTMELCDVRGMTAMEEIHALDRWVEATCADMRAALGLEGRSRMETAELDGDCGDSRGCGENGCDRCARVYLAADDDDERDGPITRKDGSK